MLQRVFLLEKWAFRFAGIHLFVGRRVNLYHKITLCQVKEGKPRGDVADFNFAGFKRHISGLRLLASERALEVAVSDHKSFVFSLGVRLNIRNHLLEQVVCLNCLVPVIINFCVDIQDVNTAVKRNNITSKPILTIHL